MGRGRRALTGVLVLPIGCLGVIYHSHPIGYALYLIAILIRVNVIPTTRPYSKEDKMLLCFCTAGLKGHCH